MLSENLQPFTQDCYVEWGPSVCRVGRHRHPTRLQCALHVAEQTLGNVCTDRHTYIIILQLWNQNQTIGGGEICNTNDTNPFVRMHQYSSMR